MFADEKTGRIYTWVTRDAIYPASDGHGSVAPFSSSCAADELYRQFETSSFDASLRRIRSFLSNRSQMNLSITAVFSIL